MRNAEDDALRDRVRRIAGLLDEVEQFADPAARAHTREIVQAILEYHGAGLGRIFAALAETGPALIDRLADDDLVGSLLLLYGLHPLEPEARVRRALERARPSLQAHGGDVELVGITGGVVRLRFKLGTGCGSSAASMQRAVEEAVCEAAPELTAIETVEWPEHTRGAIPLPVLQR